MSPSDSTRTRRGLLRTLPAAGAAALSGSRSATAQQAGSNYVVDMTDDLVFVPDSITVGTGDTVVWENVGDIGHSVTAYEDELPDGATYFASGDFDSESAARSNYPTGEVAGGESFRHTFETAGTFGYFCIPHEGVGMVGEVEVIEGYEPTTAASTEPILTDAARVLALGTAAALGSVLGLAYLFIKYGGNYGTDDAE